MSTTRLRRTTVFAATVLTALAVAPAAASAQATGSITGTITRSGGGPVTVNLFTTAGASAGQVVSDDAGHYRFPVVAAGDYKLQYGYGETYQWAYQELGFSAAAVVNVGAGATAVVDDTMLGPGVVEITATDAVSGAPVTSYCASRWEGIETDCGPDENGVLRLTSLGDGTHRLYVTAPDGLHAGTEVSDVQVSFGKVTRVAVELRPTAAIRTRVLDRATGEPVSGVCVAALPLVFGGTDDSTCEWWRNETDDNGEILLGGLEPGEYTLLAVPDRGGHGIQWVGPEGGVGSQYKALKVQARAGTPTTVSPIQLDPAATISGTITDAETGEPLLYACASVLPSKGPGDPRIGASCTQWEGEGRYAIENLGPYAWPVHFTPYQSEHASTWSGGKADRRSATLTRASATRPAVLDAQLPDAQPGITLSIVTPDGEPYWGWSYVEAVNARTGDYVGEFDSSTHQLSGVAAQAVRLRYAVDGYPAGWHGGTNFATADNVRVRPGDPTPLKITLTD